MQSKKMLVLKKISFDLEVNIYFCLELLENGKQKRTFLWLCNDFAPFLKYPVHISETQLKKHPKQLMGSIFWVCFLIHLSVRGIYPEKRY